MRSRSGFLTSEFAITALALLSWTWLRSRGVSVGAAELAALGALLTPFVASRGAVKVAQRGA